MWWGADQNSSSQCLSPQLYLPRCHISAATNGCHPGRHQHCMFFQPGEVYRSLAPGPLTAGKVCCPDGSSTSRQCLKQHIWSAAGPEVLLHDVLKDRSCSGSPLHCPLSWQVHSPSSKMREETKRQRSEELASSAPPPSQRLPHMRPRPPRLGKRTLDSHIQPQGTGRNIAFLF